MAEPVKSPSAERILLFTDAVVAIAITLLVLPLVDLVPDAVDAHSGPLTVFSGHRDVVVGFLLSFLVIGRMWLGHHELFGTVASYRHSLVLANMGWLLTIVVLPFPTEMVGAYGDDRFVAAFYVGTILVACLCQTGMAVILRTHPELTRDRGERATGTVAPSIGTAIALAAALVLGLLLPATSYYGLLLMGLVDPGIRLLRRVRPGEPGDSASGAA